MAQSRLTLFLLEGVTAPEDALDSDTESPPISLELEGSLGYRGRFFLVTRSPHPPPWLAIVEPLVAGTLDTAKTSSASGLLVLEVDSRWFAITFGYGRTLLDFGHVVRRFGLRVTLNRVDHQRLRSLDTKALEDVVVSRKTQSSRSAEAATFGVDVVQDVLRGATGEARDDRLGSRVTGSDALVVSVDLESTALPTLCREALLAFEEEGYKQHFPWVDNLEGLSTSDSRVERLEARLTELLSAGDTAKLHLAVPDVVEWQEIDAFKISGARDHEFIDLDLDEYLEQLPEDDMLTASKLRSRRVTVRFTSGPEWYARWSLLQCLIAEIKLEGELYVLTEGQWFRVSKALATRVDAYLDTLELANICTIRGKAGEVEAIFNERLDSALGNVSVLLDRTQVRLEGARSSIEPCDVLLSSGDFVHVKRKNRSSTLSHLFAQGSVSLAAFLVDGSFRDELRKLLDDRVDEADRERWRAKFPAGGTVPRREEYRVVFVVVAAIKKASGLDWLPFFSRLNLMQHASAIQSAGARVAVQLVAED